MIDGKKLPFKVIDWDLEFMDKNLPKDFWEVAKPKIKNSGKIIIVGTSGEISKSTFNKNEKEWR